MARTLDTELQRRILKAIKDFWKSNGYGPSLREITDTANVSSISVAAYHVRLLASNGAIHFTPRKARSIVVLEEAR